VQALGVLDRFKVCDVVDLIELANRSRNDSIGLHYKDDTKVLLGGRVVKTSRVSLSDCRDLRIRAFFARDIGNIVRSQKIYQKAARNSAFHCVGIFVELPARADSDVPFVQTVNGTDYAILVHLTLSVEACHAVSR
jgi:hypothetical protein